MRLVIAFILSMLMAAMASAETITVAAAVSLKEAATDAAKAYEADTGEHVELTFGSSGQLVAQIQSGAEIDAFISAANKQVDDLGKSGLVIDSTRRIICGNELVLIVPADGGSAPARFEELADPSVKRLAVGEPKTVPAGQYTEEVFKALHLDGKFGDRLIYGASVRQVLAYVENGDVTAGVVYATDAKQVGDKVKVNATANARWHEPIVYPGVVIKSSLKTLAAVKFLDYLGGEKGRVFLTARGFTVGPAATTEPGPTSAPTP